MTMVELQALARRFERFAQRECHVSPLYERLSLGIASDPELLTVATHTQQGQPAPNLFLAAVHFLLLKGAQHPVSAFYPSLSRPPLWAEDPYPSFRAFCLEHHEAMRALLSTRMVQTNEVGRCACLLPAFGLVARQAQGRPLALVEIGASAGLNLLWDRYRYDYGAGRQYGEPNSPVQIACTWRSDQPPPIPAVWPRVAGRVGLDVNPIDGRDPEAALWLRALVWPDEVGRADLLQRAIQISQHNPPTLIAGNALETLPAVLATIPDDQAVCVFHTYTINQFSPEGREHLSSLLSEWGTKRDLWRVSIEWFGGEPPQLALESCENGVPTKTLLARCGSHGEWLEWLEAGDYDEP